MNKRKVGTEYEQMAAAFLEQQGYRILQMNYRCRMGEIDVIAADHDIIVFVEVKYRSSNQYGRALEAVSPRKQRTIRQVATYYLLTQFHQTNQNCRFDVIGIDFKEITHIVDAF